MTENNKIYKQNLIRVLNCYSSWIRDSVSVCVSILLGYLCESDAKVQLSCETN